MNRFSAIDQAKKRTTAELKQLVAENGKSEYQLHCQIIQLIERCKINGLRVWHTPNSWISIKNGKKDFVQAARFKAMGCVPGVPDLILSWPGHVGFIEVKSAKGGLTDPQGAFLDDVRGHGHYTAVVKSLSEATAILEAWGAIRAKVAA